jgi:hypothetical protein
MRSILLAWEFGAGFGHVLTLRRIAERFAALGFRCVAAVKNLEAGAVLADAGVELLQAPLWKIPQSSATLGDTLGDAGFADAQLLRRQLEAWRRIIEEVAPELVVADYAPGASLAARGRVPLALVGNGFTLPPAGMQSFPLLHQVSPPVWPEQQLLDVLNSVLLDLQMQPLQKLPQLFSGDAIWMHTFPLLDPYEHWREQPAQGPEIEGVILPRAENASDIPVYLSSWSGPQRSFLDALRPVARDVRLFAAGFSAAERMRFADMGMRLQSHMFDVTKDFATARLVVHLGSVGIAGACVMAGVPQLACAIDVEKELVGKALAQAGIGKFILNFDPAVSLTEDAVAALLADRQMADRARETGEMHRKLYGGSTPLIDFETACLKLLS